VIHDLVLVVVLVFFWIGPALLVGWLAARKGRSFGLFFAAALLLFWPIVLVVTAGHTPPALSPKLTHRPVKLTHYPHWTPLYSVK
jgi:hypothetical protein